MQKERPLHRSPGDTDRGNTGVAHNTDDGPSFDVPGEQVADAFSLVQSTSCALVYQRNTPVIDLG